MATAGGKGSLVLRQVLLRRLLAALGATGYTWPDLMSRVGRVGEWVGVLVLCSAYGQYDLRVLPMIRGAARGRRPGKMEENRGRGCYRLLHAAGPGGSDSGAHHTPTAPSYAPLMTLPSTADSTRTASACPSALRTH